MSELCPPARTTTRKPVLIAPKDTCDCHFHIFGDPAHYPFVPERSYTPPVATEDQYLKMAETLGVQRMVVVQPSVYGFDNRCTLDAIANLGPQRARGIVLVGADVTDSELRRMDAAGVRGVRFITFAAGGAPLDQLKAVARKIAAYGWHIQMYVRPQQLLELAPTIRDLPVPVVFDHLGAISADAGENDPALAAILRLLDAEKAWVKLSAYRSSIAGHPYRDANWIAKTYIARAGDRCVWGSDWPHPNMHGYMPDDGDLLDLLLECEPDAAIRHRILADNPRRLYGFA